VNTSTGAIAERIDYDEFGNIAAGTGPGTGTVSIPFGFAGGIYDPDSGLTRFGSRDYDASVGRWTNKDPARFVGGMNVYAYASNDPVNRTDPRGRDGTTIPLPQPWTWPVILPLVSPIVVPAVICLGFGALLSADTPDQAGVIPGEESEAQKREACNQKCSKPHLEDNQPYVGNDGHVYVNDSGGAHAFQRCYAECMGWL
jgi:RHS repeat-associated protein